MVTNLYKLMARVLSNRTKEVFHEVIDGNQFAFIKDRNILDSILIPNECVEEYRTKKKKRLVLKLDTENSFGRTDWDFLDFTMARKSFGSRWQNWIEGCLSSSHFSIMINGTPQGFFQASRSLR